MSAHLFPTSRCLPNSSEVAGQTSYFINLPAMEFNSNNFNITPVNLGITGNFEGNGV